MNKEYISIAEYAEIKGISKQAVYKQCSTKLKPYVSTVDGRKVLKSDVLSGQVETTNNQRQRSSSTKTVEEVDIIAFLKEQIKEKDIQIQRLQESEKEKDRHIQNQSEKLAELLAQSNALQQNNQLLIKMLGDGSIDTKTDNSTIVTEENIVQKEQPKEQPKQQPKKHISKKKKRGLFSRLFG